MLVRAPSPSHPTLTDPDECLPLIWVPFPSYPTLTDPDELQALVWVSSPSYPTITDPSHLTLTDPDELQMLVWAPFPSIQLSLTQTSAHCSSGSLSHIIQLSLTQTSAHCSSGPFPISTNSPDPDKLQALIWVAFFPSHPTLTDPDECSSLVWVLFLLLNPSFAPATPKDEPQMLVWACICISSSPDELQVLSSLIYFYNCISIYIS